MTQRERIDDHNAEVYNAPTRMQPMRQTITHDTPDYDVDVITPTDRVRWGPVIAGLFSALATLAALTILGLAVGGAAFGPASDASDFGIGALIWSALSVLASFFVGGWMAARTSALRGRSAGILNGAMVWFVAIPLLLYGLATGISSLIGTAGNLLGTAAQTAAPAVAAGAAAVDDPTALTNAVQQAAPDLSADQVQGIVTNLQNQATTAVTDPQNQDAVADTVGDNAWRTLLGLGLAAGAAVLGGIAGSGRKDEIDQRLTA